MWHLCNAQYTLDAEKAHTSASLSFWPSRSVMYRAAAALRRSSRRRARRACCLQSKMTQGEDANCEVASVCVGSGSKRA